MSRRFPFALVLSALTGLIAAPSMAQSNESIFEVAESQKDTFAEIGAAYVSRDTYLGSDQRDNLFLPYVNATYKGRYFLLPALGAGVHLINKDKVRLSGSVNYELGREGVDTPFQNETFDVDGSFTANAAGRVLLPFAALDVVGTAPFTGDVDGFRVATLLTTQITPTDRIKINPGVRASYYSDDWLNSYYGVSGEQALASGLAPAGFDSEFASYGAHVIAYYTVTDSIEIVGTLIYAKLTGDVKDSAFTPENDGLTAGIAIARRF